MVQIVRFRWPGRAVGIVGAVKLSLLIRVADEGRFPQCNWIPAGQNQQDMVDGKVPQGSYDFLTC